MEEAHMKRVLITGVSRGIGKGFARYYLEAGAEVFGSVRNPEDAADFKEGYGERFHTLVFDVRDTEAIRSAAVKVRGTAEGLDLIINNAGIAPDEPGTGVTEIDEDQVMTAFDVNVLGQVRVLKAFFPLLKGGENPKLINISSIVGSMDWTEGGRAIPYCVSKASLNMMSLLLSFRLEEHRIPIAAIHPGSVKTDMGGSGSALSVEESVRAIAGVIENLTLDSSLFIDYRGKKLPW
jgi:NAD(P)-dependent dehydrogenase (short-subunit alcohol dehydrogenase family)